MAAAAARRVVQQVSQLQKWKPYSHASSCNTDLLMTGFKFRLPSAASSSPLFVEKGCGTDLLLRLTPSITWSNAARRLEVKHISQLVKTNGKRAFLVDTLALVRRLEAQGMPSKQAEAITAAITEVLNDSLENVAQSFVSKAEMQKSEMTQEAALSKFKAEVQSSQEHHFSLLQRETEKLRTDIDKMRSELRYEIDKVTAGQRLDLNLERG
eukprot:Gb_03855 [translate_table: standard]